MLLEAECSSQESHRMGVSAAILPCFDYPNEFDSVPVGLQYEKFHIPDSIRILDALVETLTY